MRLMDAIEQADPKARRARSAPQRRAPNSRQRRGRRIEPRPLVEAIAEPVENPVEEVTHRFDPSNSAAFVDVAEELLLVTPDGSEQALSDCVTAVHEAAGPLARRDALVRLAAWAVHAAGRMDAARRAGPPASLLAHDAREVE